VDRNDKVFTLLYKIVMPKKMSHPDEIQNTTVRNAYNMYYYIWLYIWLYIHIIRLLYMYY